MLGAHEDEKHRHVRAFSDAVPVEVGTHTHAVSVGAGVERRRVETDGATLQCVMIPSAYVGYLPDEHTVCRFHVEDILSETHLVNHDCVLC